MKDEDIGKKQDDNDIRTQEVKESEIEALHQKLEKEAEEAGYHLNPDKEFTRQLIRALIINTERYGYWACPCRLASGKKEQDLDIVCPCDYRDPDLAEFGMCFCALYVSKDVKDGKKRLAGSIPERRPVKETKDDTTTKDVKEMEADIAKTEKTEKKELSHPVWRCRVCGYLAARDEPPETCPICKVPRERFERFM